MSSERGFTLIELLVAMMLASVGIISVVSVFDGSRDLITTAEKNEVATHIAERELERAQAVDFAALGLAALPSPSSDPADPDFYVKPSARYQWEHKAGGATETLVAGGSLARETTWQDPASRLRGEVHRYVTSTSADNKLRRVTIAVTVEGKGLTKPAVISTVITDPVPEDQP